MFPGNKPRVCGNAKIEIKRKKIITVQGVIYTFITLYKFGMHTFKIGLELSFIKKHMQ